MNDFKKLNNLCKKYNCFKCPLYRETKCCEFKRSPRYWDIEKIQKVLKINNENEKN